MLNIELVLWLLLLTAVFASVARRIVVPYPVVLVLGGLAMSPAMDAAWPWLTDLFGGLQSARSVHVIVAWLLVGFFVGHMVMLLLSGPVGRLRAMVTGRAEDAR